jgi:hypothetical protein
MLNYQSLAQIKNLARIIERHGLLKARPLKLGEVLDALSKGHGFKSWGALAPTLTKERIDAELSDFERTHLESAEEVGQDSYGAECGIQTHTGFFLRTPAPPAPCDYVRVCDPLGREIGYWRAKEWAEAPEDVMGAVVGALCRGISQKLPKNKDIPDLPELPAPNESDVATAMSTDFWPPGENLSRKELMHQIGQMNFALDVLRKQTTSLTSRTQAQALELSKRQKRSLKYLCTGNSFQMSPTTP